MKPYRYNDIYHYFKFHTWERRINRMEFLWGHSSCFYVTSPCEGKLLMLLRSSLRTSRDSEKRAVKNLWKCALRTSFLLRSCYTYQHRFNGWSHYGFFFFLLSHFLFSKLRKRHHCFHTSESLANRMFLVLSQHLISYKCRL